MCRSGTKKVILSDGSKLNIEEVEPVQMVKTFDTDENVVSEGFVGDVQEIEVETLIQIKFEDGLVIKTTPEHPFYLSNREDAMHIDCKLVIL